MSSSSQAPPQLVLTSISPARVLSAGGDLPVTLYGSGFVAGLVAVVGQLNAQVALTVTGPGTATFTLGGLFTLSGGQIPVFLEELGTGRSSNTIQLQVDDTPASQINLLSDAYQATGYFSQIILTNPARHPVSATLRYLPDITSSATPTTATVTVPAQSIRVVDMSDSTNGTTFTQCGIEITSGTPILAALWMSNPSNSRMQTYESQHAASTRHILGLGLQLTGSYSSYVELANPGTQDANITVTAYPHNADPVTQMITLNAARTLTHTFPGSLDYLTVEVSSDQPVVAQQSVSGITLKTFGASGSVGAGSARLVVPFLQIGTADLTRFSVYNPQTTSQTASISMFSGGNTAIATLSADAHRTPQFTPDTTNTPWMDGTTLCATVDAVELVGSLVTAPPSLTVGDRGRMLLSPPATTMVAGAFQVGGGWNARLAVCNPSQGPMDVVVQFLSTQGVDEVSRSVPAQSVLVLDSGSSVDGFPSPGNGWVGAVVQTNVPTAAAVVNNGPSGERVLVGAQIANGP